MNLGMNSLRTQNLSPPKVGLCWLDIWRGFEVVWMVSLLEWPGLIELLNLGKWVDLDELLKQSPSSLASPTKSPTSLSLFAVAACLIRCSESWSKSRKSSVSPNAKIISCFMNHDHDWVLVCWLGRWHSWSSVYLEHEANQLLDVSAWYPFPPLLHHAFLKELLFQIKMRSVKKYPQYQCLIDMIDWRKYRWGNAWGNFIVIEYCLIGVYMMKHPNYVWPSPDPWLVGDVTWPRWRDPTDPCVSWPCTTLASTDAY